MVSMKLSIKQAEILNLCNAVNVLVDEAHIEVSPNALTFRGMDPSHIALLDIQIPSVAFETYEVEGTVKFGVRTQELAKVVKRFKNETIHLELADSMLNLYATGKIFKQRLVESSASSTPLPKLDFKSKVELDKPAFDDAMADIQVCSEFVQFIAKPDELELFGRGDIGEASRVIQTQTGVTEEQKATYSLDYLTKMSKAVSADKVTLQYSSKMPLKLSVGFADYYLAPRVQD